jgi:hypothetical protein
MSHEDELACETLDRGITAAMLRVRKQHDTPWAPSLIKVTHIIWYWTKRISKSRIRQADDHVLEYCLEHSDVEAAHFDKTMSVKNCASELRNARVRFKDVLAKEVSHSDLYEAEVSTARVERRYPHIKEDNVNKNVRNEWKKEVKQREIRRSSQKSFRKLRYQIRGHVKPNYTRMSSINRLDVQTKDDLWFQIVGKCQVEEHLIERNVEQFSYSGATPLGYNELGLELGHTGYTPMAEAIRDGTFKHDSLSDDSLEAIVKQIWKHPAVTKFIQAVVTEADFKTAFKCVPEKTTSSFYGPGGVHQYKVCAEGSEDGLADVQSENHAERISVPLVTGFCPER